MRDPLCRPKDPMMLRITRQPGADHDTLLLEGKLLKEWIEELQQAFAQERQDGAAIALDLSGLRFIDDEGVRFLRECRRRGASLLGASPFVSALLDPPPKRRRRPRS
jgi:ABC-type transporter Mla MlaB component